MGTNAGNLPGGKNKVWIAGGLALSQQTDSPIATGDVGIYRDSNDVLQLVYADGSTRQISSAALWDTVRVATEAVLPNSPTYSTTTKAYTAGSNVSINSAGIDSITDLAVGNRVLVKTQSSSRNGIYEVTTVGGAVPWVLTRTHDAFYTEQFATGKLVAVSEGTINSDSLFMLATNAPITLDSTTLSFAAAPLSITYGLIGDIVTVSLTASAPGVSTKVARADHGHILSQSISPTWSGVHNFAASALKVDNNSTTNAHTFISAATQARNITIPDAALTIAQAGVATAGPGTAIPMAGHYTLVPPTAEATAGASTLVSDVVISAVALTIAAQPACPCKLNIYKTDVDSSYAATLTIVGKGPAGEAIAGEVVSLVAVDGTHTYVTTNAYSVITSATVSGLSGNTGVDKVAIGQATALGLPIPSGAGSVVVYKACVGATPASLPVSDTVGTVDATARTIVPNTASNSTKAQHFWFSYTLASHTHLQT